MERVRIRKRRIKQYQRADRKYFNRRNKCPDCVGTTWTGIKQNSTVLTKKRRATIALLLKGGITDRCQLACATMMGHKAFKIKAKGGNQPLIRPLLDRVTAEWLESFQWRSFDSADTLRVYGNSVRCSHCKTILSGIPCQVCTISNKLAARFYWLAARETEYIDVGGIRECRPIMRR